MSKCEFTFTITRTGFDENYYPADNTRITTNFANLARGSSRRDNLRNTLTMINNRFNCLANWDNPRGDRYSIQIEIISVDMGIDIEGNSDEFPLIEILQTIIHDKKTDERIDGVVGNNFSSYVRDYDFSIVLPDYHKSRSISDVPEDFGDLHGILFKSFLNSNVYRDHFAKPPVICLSVSSAKSYRRTGNEHPILGIEYQTDRSSSTDQYFAKMGLKVRYFMPRNSVAPLAFYHLGDLPGDYSNIELIGTISTMETFQKIYRPEIYNANSAATEHYQPSLNREDFSLTRIIYDREERSRLAVQQGKFAEERLIKPYRAVLEQWSTSSAL